MAIFRDPMHLYRVGKRRERREGKSIKKRAGDRWSADVQRRVEWKWVQFRIRLRLGVQVAGTSACALWIRFSMQSGISNYYFQALSNGFSAGRRPFEFLIDQKESWVMLKMSA